MANIEKDRPEFGDDGQVTHLRVRRAVRLAKDEIGDPRGKLPGEIVQVVGRVARKIISRKQYK